MSYGGNFGTVNFIWKIPTLQEERDESAQARTMLKKANSLTEFHTRQMHYDFIDKYKTAVKSSKSVMRFMYQELTGHESAASTGSHNVKQHQIPEVFHNLSSLNFFLT